MPAYSQIVTDIETRETAADAPYPRGYRAQLDPIVARRLKDLHATQFWRPAGRAVLTHATAFASMLAFCWIAAHSMVAALIAALPAGILMAREMRVLELLVHNASHRNWTRDKKLNDISAALLCGLPMASSIAAYWDQHRIHHHEFGSVKDPDRAGFEFLGPLDLNDKRATMKWLVRYAIQYYQAIGASPKFLFGSLAWHCVVYIAPLSLLVGPALAVTAWTCLWLFPMLTFLSALRAIAEREEHDYELGDTEFTATFNNIARAHKILFHPWNDHYHLLHHLYAGIPQFNHVEAHRLLMEHDPEYRACRARIAILGKPVPTQDVPGQIPAHFADRPASDAPPMPITDNRAPSERPRVNRPRAKPSNAAQPILVRAASGPVMWATPEAPPAMDLPDRR